MASTPDHVHQAAADADIPGGDPEHAKHAAAVQAALDRVMIEEAEVLHLLKDT